MLTHGQIWTALDRLAEHAGLSPSGLAKKSGLDATTFNRSKRIASDGRERWPSTESVAKALGATNIGMETFLKFLDKSIKPDQTVPLIGFAQAGAGGYFDDGGFPVGEGWDKIGLPAITDEHAYALEISGDSMRPAYHDGDIIIVSPGAPIHRGDRVVVKTTSGEVIVKELSRRNSKTIELQSLNPDHADRTLAINEVEWLARIIWVSQ